MAISWDTAADWDAVENEDGVVHESVSNTDHNDAGTVKRGYTIAEPLLSQGLALFLPFQEDNGSTANDFSGNGNHGSINGPTVGQPGILNTSCYEFDASNNDEVSIPNSTSFLDTETMTWAGWINPDDATDRWICSNRQDGGGTTADYRLRFDGDSHLEWTANTTNGWENGRTGNTQFTTGAWQFYTVTYDINRSNELQLYYNGSPDGTDTISQIKTDGGDLDYGSDSDTSSADYPDGSFGPQFIWTRALSDAEVALLYDVYATNGTLTTDWRTP